MVDDTAPQPRVGRPRAQTREDPNADPREEILSAARELFWRQGYAATSTRQIAQAVGLRQASLFYYFAQKDEILAELLDRTSQPVLDFIGQAAGIDAAADVRLHMLVTRDLRNFCRPHGSLGTLQLQREAPVERFPSFWEKQGKIREAYQDLIREGSETGHFAVEDVALTTSTIFGLVESVGTWFDPALHDPQSVSRAVSEAALRSILVNADSISLVESEARRELSKLELATA